MEVLGIFFVRYWTQAVQAHHEMAPLDVRNEGRDFMYKVLCPLCGRRVCDIVTTTKKQVIVELRCPQCNRIVRVEFTLPAEKLEKTK